MSLMRLFTGVPIPEQVADTLQETVERLRPHADLNWTKREGWHITIKFIGQWPEDRLGELKSALNRVKADGPIDIEVLRFGYFPKAQRPHTFFAGVQADAPLQALALEVETQCEALGIARETRSYTPHVTVAKIKGQSVVALREEVTRMDTMNFGSFQAKAFCLYESRGGRYTVLETYPLVTETAPQ